MQKKFNLTWNGRALSSANDYQDRSGVCFKV